MGALLHVLGVIGELFVGAVILCIIGAVLLGCIINSMWKIK